MQYLIYISSSYKLMTEDELLDVLTVSRQNNTQRNLTGMLLYGEGVFIQVLEGEPETLHETYKIIEADPRHKNIIKMAEGFIEERNFPDWSMGFKSINAQELATFEGYINPTKGNITQHAKETPVISMLKSFLSANRLA